MTDQLTSQDLSDAQALLITLFNEVNSQESVLAGGRKLGKGGQALQGLLDTKVSFGNPRSSLIRLTSKLFEDVGVKLTAPQKQQLEHHLFNFYYMTLSVSIQPGREAKFSQLICDLDFSPKGNDEPIVQTIFPTSHWKEKLSIGGSMHVALDGNLGLSADLSTLPFPQIQQLPVQVQASTTAQGTFNAFIATPNYSFQLGKADIYATGEENSHCYWRIEDFDLQKAQTIQFCIVFKVPQNIKTVELTGLVAFTPSMGWLIDSIRDVFEHLSKKLQTLLRQSAQNRSGKPRLFVSDEGHETWTLHLP